MKVIVTDGGRKAAGFKEAANDCVTRSVAIAAQRPYAAVYGELSEINARMPKTSGRKTAGLVSASYGIYTTSKLFKDYMRKLFRRSEGVQPTAISVLLERVCDDGGCDWKRRSFSTHRKIRNDYCRD